MLNQFKPGARRWLFIGMSLIMIAAIAAVSLPLQRVSASGLAATCSTYHTVSSGETLSSIALKYNTTVQEIAAANNLKEPYTIVVGQRLCIPAGATVATATTTADESLSSKNPDFIVSPGPYTNWVTIKVAKLGGKKPYYVRVYQTGRSGTAKKIGTLRTDKDGSAKRSFKLPKQFRDVSSLTYCLKDPFTDKVLCKVY